MNLTYGYDLPVAAMPVYHNAITCPFRIYLPRIV